MDGGRGGRAACSWLTFRLTFWQIRFLTKYSIKEESKVANRDWVDHQAYSLLQYINVVSVEVSNIARCSSKTNELRDIDSIGCRTRNITI